MSLLGRIARRCISKNVSTNVKQVRHSHGEWTYRTIQEPVKWSVIGESAAATLTFWWFFWNFYYGHKELLMIHGGRSLPIPSKWTDEELGIPPDDC